MPDVSERPHRTGVFWIDIAVALAAVCISVASLWIALRTDRTQERLLAASVWPVLLFETSDYAESGSPGETRHIIRFSITNAGVGPARVKWFDRALLRQCCEPGKARPLSRVLISNYMQTRVMTARETIKRAKTSTFEPVTARFLTIVGFSIRGSPRRRPCETAHRLICRSSAGNSG